MAVLRLIRDPETSTAMNAMRTLVNLSAEEAGATALLTLVEPELVGEMIKVRVLGEVEDGKGWKGSGDIKQSYFPVFILQHTMDTPHHLYSLLPAVH